MNALKVAGIFTLAATVAAASMVGVFVLLLKGEDRRQARNRTITKRVEL